MQPCNVNSCGLPGFSRSMCRKHYQAWYKENPHLVRRVIPAGVPCAVEGCEREHKQGKYCTMHGQRVRIKGDPGEAGSKMGKGTLTPKGYVQMRAAGRSIAEHRLVMEKVLGRELLPGENVHHLNGERHDNRPENLELWVVRQTPGQRVTDLVAWICQDYPDLVREYMR